MPRAIGEFERGERTDGAGLEPGGEVDLGGVGAARRRGGERGALAFAEVDVELRVGELGQVVEGRGEAPGGGVGVELARRP